MRLTARVRKKMIWRTINRAVCIAAVRTFSCSLRSVRMTRRAVQRAGHLQPPRENKGVIAIIASTRSCCRLIVTKLGQRMRLAPRSCTRMANSPCGLFFQMILGTRRT